MATNVKQPLDDFAKATLAYKYCSPNLSLFERAFLNQFWENFVYLYPTWLAPNCISVTGLACILLQYALSWYLSPALQGEAQPKEIYALFGFLLFAYQTLDGSDGKQARRTKSGSALGELMDHGIDAVVTGFAAVVVCDALGLGIDGITPWMAMIGGQMTFFMSNLTLLHRGKQVFFPVDVMELQWVMIVSLILTGVYGKELWKMEIPLPWPLAEAAQTWLPFNEIATGILGLRGVGKRGTFQPQFVVAFGAVYGTIQNFILYCYFASAPYRASRAEDVPDHVKRGVPGTGVGALLYQICIIFTFGALAAYCRNLITRSPETDFQTKVSAWRALIATCSFAFGDLMDRVLIMRVAHRPLPVVPPTLLLLGVFSLFANTRGFTPSSFSWWWAVALASLLAHLSFFVTVSRKLARVLGITVFTIKKVDVAPTAAAAEVKKKE